MDSCKNEEIDYPQEFYDPLTCKLIKNPVTNNEIHDANAMFLLPDPSPWMHLPEATLVCRHSNIVELELGDGTFLRANLSSKLKGVKLVIGDRLRYTTDLMQAKVVAVMPRLTLLKRGGINDREPWQLICANVDELWICLARLNPPFRLGLIERAQALALSSNMSYKVIITKQDQIITNDIPLDLDRLRLYGLSVFETSATSGYGLDALQEIYDKRRVALVGHSGVGKSTLINTLIPTVKQRIGSMSRYGTGRQTTTGSRWFSCGKSGAIIDTPGIRNLSVRGLSRNLLPQVFPELPLEYINDPMNLDKKIEINDMVCLERLLNLQKLWIEMEEHNPNQNIYR
jgi:ribosome biogenesis GTPase